MSKPLVFAVPLLAGFALAAPAATPVVQKVTGPIANYWLSVSTSSGSGFGAMMAGGGGNRPGLGDMMRMMRGGTAVDRALLLQLGSTQRATGAAKADHFPGAGTPLPLITPQAAPPAAPTQEETIEEQPRMPDRPRGRILLYWGCGEHAPAGQPIVLDFSKLTAGQPIPHIPFVAVRHQNPPSAGRYATYGEWPAGRSNLRPPASLVGDHAVRGSYSPEIKFALPADRDYMAPLVLDASQKSAAGGTRLSWGAIPHATGYFAMLFGASAERGQSGDEPTLVMWSSSGVSTFAGGGLLEYLAPAEVQRLIGQKVVMPPNQTQCVVPAEVAKPGQFGLVSMITYGPEANFVDPPRPPDPKLPWNMRWTVKARYKSTTGVMLGMAAASAASAAAAPSSAATPAPAPQQKKRGGLLGKLKDAADSVVR